MSKRGSVALNWFFAAIVYGIVVVAGLATAAVLLFVYVTWFMP